MENEGTADSEADLIAQVRRSLGISTPEEVSDPPATSLVEEVEGAPKQPSLRIAEPALRIADQLLGESTPGEPDVAFGSDIRLVVEVEGRRFTVPPDGLKVGRSVDSADIEISDSRVSRRHAYFMRQGDEITIVDLGSTNGTVILRDGKRLQVDSEPIEVEQGDQIVTQNNVPLASIVVDMVG